MVKRLSLTLIALLAGCDGSGVPGADARTIKAGQSYTLAVPPGTPTSTMRGEAERLCAGALVGCSVTVFAQNRPPPSDYVMLDAAADRAAYTYRSGRP